MNKNESKAVTQLTPEAQKLLDLGSKLPGGSDIIFNRVKIIKETAHWMDEVMEKDLGTTIFFVVTYHTRSNGLWLPDSHEKHNPELIGTKNPDCISLDGVNASTKMIQPDGHCFNCDFNRWGSVEKLDGKAGKGKACKNMMRLAGYIVPEGYQNLSVDEYVNIFTGDIFTITLPPTSIGSDKKDDGKYLFDTKKLRRKKIAYPMAVRELKLKKESGPKFEWTEVSCKTVFDITNILLQRPEVVNKYAVTQQAIKNELMRTDITAEDYMQDENSFDSDFTAKENTKEPW